MNSNSTLRQSGFTLMELMIVVVIVGILAAIAYPSYTRYVQRANETEVKGQIIEFASQLEAYRAKNFSYEGAELSVLSPNLEKNPHYSVKQPEYLNNNQHYTIIAEPKKTMGGWPKLTYDSATGPSWD